MPGILDILTPVLGPIIDRVFPDPQEKRDFQLKLEQLADQDSQRAHDEMMGQIAVNTAEASNRSVFVAGWRPFIGWGCGASLIYSTLAAPMFHLQVPDLSFLQTVLMAMLGIGAMRSYDKKQGTANDILPIFPRPVTPIASATTVLPSNPRPKKKILGIAWPF